MADQSKTGPTVLMNGPAVPLFVAISAIIAVSGFVYGLRAGELRQLERERADLYERVYQREMVGLVAQDRDADVERAELRRMITENTIQIRQLTTLVEERLTRP